jgi:endonuclease IV
MTILDLGKFLNKLFKDLNINIYPVIAENSTLKDYAVYERLQTRQFHKDRQFQEATYLINLVSSQYNTSIDMLQKVIDACNRIYAYESERIQLLIETTSESYSDAYIQTVTINIKI